MSKILTAYFSASGVTEKVAERLAQAAGADIFKIEPKVPYTEADLDWRNKNSRSSIEMQNLSLRPEIKEIPLDISKYDTVFIGYPVWWYIAPTIINTFLESLDLKGKTVIPFATSGSSGIGNTEEYLSKSCNGAKLLEGKRFDKDVSKEELSDWVKGFWD